MPNVHGTLSYVGVVLDDRTRTVLARAVLSNPSGDIRPGLFVTARVAVETVSAPIIVPRESVQDLDDAPCVFVREGDAFLVHHVAIGRSDDASVEITSGLEVGDTVATSNSFRLKAEVRKQTLGSGNHGHVH
jgi:cobalt-zinc-cadmium efflux system membrane fusion protein